MYVSVCAFMDDVVCTLVAAVGKSSYSFAFCFCYELYFHSRCLCACSLLGVHLFFSSVLVWLYSGASGCASAITRCSQQGLL